MSIIQIKSDNKIADINRHFKVTAGPGAGKTYWLINHIKNVLHNSDKLHKTGKIACITYTNIAVETILSRLGESSSNQVEVSTIHSFLYKNIVKPYASFIADEYNLNVAKMDGHDEIYVSFSKINHWIENHPNHSKLKHPYTLNQLVKLANNKNALMNWLRKISYDLDTKNNEINIIADIGNAYYVEQGSYKYLSKSCLNILASHLLAYKKLYWQEGQLSHDDVLFFSFQIIQKYPFVAKVLALKFPYVFVDEFQDSNPIQVEIVKLLASSGAFIGVIGDIAQSIYEFQGANMKLFESFSVPKMVKYQLSENRRSANEIIDVLNYLRTDINQQKFRQISYDKPIIMIGEKNFAYNKAVEMSNSEEVHSLSRQNVTSNIMKYNVSGITTDSKLFDKYRAEDSSNRYKLISSFIKAIAYANETKFNDAIKELNTLFRTENNKLVKNRKSLDILTLLVANYSKYINSTLLNFVNDTCIPMFPEFEIAKLTRGKAKEFCESVTIKQLLLCVSIPEDTSLHKTIHKAKGDEFDNVFLVLTEEKHLDFLINPALLKKENEEHRINYVAISRARNRLFINVPTLSAENELSLSNLFNLIKI